MIEEIHFSLKRLRNIIYIALTAVLLPVAFSLRYHFLIDQTITMIFIVALFVPMIIAIIESERRKGKINPNKASDYFTLTIVFIISAIVYFGFSFLPVYFAPVIIPAIFLSAVSNTTIGMAIAIYFNVMLCMVSECSYYELAAYVCLTVSGCLLTVILSERKYRIYGNVILFFIAMTIPCMFFYLSDFTINHYIFIYGAISGLIGNVIVLVFFERVSIYAKVEVYRSLHDIIAENYPLVQEIRQYSEIDYAHAVKVSQIASSCAKEIGVDEDVTAAAGFYYRLGKLEGEPFIENGVLLAQANCFPVAMVQILSEYNGEMHLPSTIESAIVHMVDSVVTKFDLLDKNTFASAWNHDIVIYQTLNEKSSSGIYDASGLGMNQYLRIREFLVKEVDLF